MLKWWLNRKKWQARRKHLIQGRLDMLPLDQAWAEISQQQFADLVSASSGERSNARRLTPSVSNDPRDGYALGDPKRLAFESRNW